ncbi:hypothetical protein NC653_027301 [Populus alba x Populus x berolinensis]|uniref:Uncharacterized protein n=1 Tax=Populus alba x Populus x berolinensis TaxID=444605 RepID=A0AAD6M5B3_9ROSI|nr:hypothetical protein NC653_027301 [Populus alba x Populus x berolinensis]
MLALVSNFEEESLEGEGDERNIWVPHKPLKIGSDQIRQNQIHVQRNERKLRFLKEECEEEGRVRSDNTNSKLERAIGFIV